MSLMSIAPPPLVNKELTLEDVVELTLQGLRQRGRHANSISQESTRPNSSAAVSSHLPLDGDETTQPPLASSPPPVQGDDEDMGSRLEVCSSGGPWPPASSPSLAHVGSPGSGPPTRGAHPKRLGLFAACAMVYQDHMQSSRPESPESDTASSTTPTGRSRTKVSFSQPVAASAQQQQQQQQRELSMMMTDFRPPHGHRPPNRPLLLNSCPLP